MNASVMARQGALFLQRQKEREMREMSTSNQNSECKFPVGGTSQFPVGGTKEEIATGEARELLPSRSNGTWAEGFADGVLFMLKRWRDTTGK